MPPVTSLEGLYDIRLAHRAILNFSMREFILA